MKTEYHQTRVSLEEVDKTEFNTEHGHFEFRNEPTTFQTLMNDIFRDRMNKLVVAYMDYSLIFSKSVEDLFVYLENVLKRVSKQQLFLAKDSSHRNRVETGIFELTLRKYKK